MMNPDLISKEEIMHLAMWNTYNKVLASNFQMGNLPAEEKVGILWWLIDYFKEFEHYEICLQLKKQIEKINDNRNMY